MTKKGTILTLCAHNDDQIIGAGGALVKYAKEGRTVRTVIFSFGQNSHPHLKPEIIIEQRVKESLKSDKILGGAGIAYLGLKEGKFEEEFKKHKIKARIKKLVQREKPEKIFTHSRDDPHPDHRAIYGLVCELINEKIITCDVYTFDVWNIVKINDRQLPKLVVDVSKTFNTKIKAFKAHYSQKTTVFILLWRVYLRALLNGINNNCRYAEVFTKLN